MALPKILTHSQREQAAATGLQIRAAVPAAACLVDGEDHRKRPQALHGVTYCGDALPADGDSTLQVFVRLDQHVGDDGGRLVVGALVAIDLTRMAADVAAEASEEAAGDEVHRIHLEHR